MGVAVLVGGQNSYADEILPSMLMTLVRRVSDEIRPILSSRTMVLLLGLLLSIDVMFMLMHIAHLQARRLWTPGSIFFDYAFSIEEDGGYSERFEYLKTLICIMALAGCWFRTRQPIYLALSAIFGFILLDNTFMLHETLGESASARVSPSIRLSESAPFALGEVAFFAIAGTVMLGILAFALMRSAARHRLFGFVFLLLLLGLAGFGVVVDLLHAATAESHRAVNWFFGLVEDGGELAMLSLACALSCALYAQLAAGRQPPHRATAAEQAPGPIPRP